MSVLNSPKKKFFMNSRSFCSKKIRLFVFRTPEREYLHIHLNYILPLYFSDKSSFQFCFTLLFFSLSIFSFFFPTLLSLNYENSKISIVISCKNPLLHVQRFIRIMKKMSTSLWIFFFSFCFKVNFRVLLALSILH